MALLTITFVSGAVMGVDSASTLQTPGGPRLAGDLVAGDFASTFSDGYDALEIASAEEAG